VKKLYLALLSYTGQVEIETKNAITSAIADANALGWMVYDVARVGDSAVARGRNSLVAEFLASDATDLIFADADVSWQPRALVKLAAHPVDLVLGCYPSRRDPVCYSIRWLPDPDGRGLQADPATGLLEIEGGPGGFFRVTRAAIERMIAFYPELWYHDELVPGGKAYALFDFMLDREQHLYFTEDFVFCRRWRALGGKVWLDPEIEFGHTGRHTWRGSIGNWLRQRNIVSQPERTI